MKKVTFLTAVLLMFVTVNTVTAQDNQECIRKYNFFKGDYQTKKYEDAKKHLNWLLENCPKLSLKIYVDGTAVAKATNDHSLVTKLYKMRLANYPNRNAAKAHDSYVLFLIKNKLGSDEQIFNILKKAYTISPKTLSGKNILRYFQSFSERNKETNPEKVFDTYDNVMESVEEKLDDYRKKIAILKKKEEAGTIDSKEKRKLGRFIKNSKSLGDGVAGGLEQIISEIATCPRLIPLLSRDFETNKSDATWLRRSVSRLHNKGCQSDPLYEKLARAYAEASPSADAYNFLAGILEKNGDEKGASKMREKAFSLETDPLKKAKLKLIAAQEASSSGKRSKARRLANEALQFNPNMGKAYLLIASMYAKSANSCGNSIFEKRMVYVAALNKARKAQAVDPGCGAGRFIANYRKNLPTKKDVFTEGVASGSSHRIGCWIGETVRVP